MTFRLFLDDIDRGGFVRFASALLVFLWPVAAAAQSPGSCLLVTEPEPVEEKESAETQKALPDFVFKGFAATSYNLNFPKPANSRNLVHGYELDDRKLKLDGLNLDFEYGLSGDDQVGFRLDTVLGGSYPRIDSAAGLFRDPTEDFSLVANYYQGAEQIRNDQNQRQLWELIANYKVTEEITLGAEVLRAHEQGLGLGGGTAHWNSLVLYWTNRISDQFSLNFRQEWFNDPEGARILPGAHVSGFTVTPEYRITEDWVVRADFRFDRADRAVFDRAGQMVRQQNTFFLGQSYRF